MYYQFPIDSLTSLIQKHPVCIVLDTARPSPEQRYSFVFVRPEKVHVCESAEKIPEYLETIDTLSKSRWVAGYLSYEAGYGLEKRFSGFRRRQSGRKKPLAWFGVFDTPYIYDHCVGRWNRDPETGPDNKAPDRDDRSLKIHHALIYKQYARSIAKIKRLIAAGDVYQVNFTYDLAVETSIDAWDLYKKLRNNQPVPFGAFINTGTRNISSFSPELFFMKQGSRITTRPMKGTAARGRYTVEDAERSAALAADPKNRSENVMIVDLLRNDLGKICRTGSVRTTSLFDVERHPTVLQMTSTVEGVLEKGVSLSSLFKAIFPCGSVTGAPKIRAMEVIHELEKGERGVYCGAIGYSSPQGRAVFSVPIRTLERNAGDPKWRYRVGSGIVWDSKAGDEWRECHDKCGFLTAKTPEFTLFESILFDKQKLVFCTDHKKRILDAADYFGFDVSGKEWDSIIKAIVAGLKKHDRSHKVRVIVDKTGIFSWDSEPLETAAENGPRRAIISGKPIDTGSPFLFHKTAIRPWYRKSMDAIRSGKCFDVIHFNKEGRLTEGARTNIFLKINNHLYTPPVECGLLPGILRGRMLKAGTCEERMLTIKDLKTAEAVFCGNSVRGLVEVVVKGVLK